MKIQNVQTKTTATFAAWDSAKAPRNAISTTALIIAITLNGEAKEVRKNTSKGGVDYYYYQVSGVDPHSIPAPVAKVETAPVKEGEEAPKVETAPVPAAPATPAIPEVWMWTRDVVTEGEYVDYVKPVVEKPVKEVKEKAPKAEKTAKTTSKAPAKTPAAPAAPAQTAAATPEVEGDLHIEPIDD